MKKTIHLFVLIFLCLQFSCLQAQNLIYQKINNDKNNGKSFELVKGIFVKSEINRDIIQEFKKEKEISFIKYDSTFFDKLPKTFTLEVPLNNGGLLLEIEAVDDEFYNYTVTNEKGEAFPSHRGIKHYRGIIKDDKNSLVALSFGKESVNGIVSNQNGNFNVSSINETSNIIFFQDNNTIYENSFSCGVIESNVKNQDDFTSIQNLSKETLNFDTFKCLRIYFELRYDMYERYGSIHSPGIYDGISMSKTVGYFSSVFNQVALLYYNAGINAYISELKINTQPDPYPLFQVGKFTCGTDYEYSNNSLCIYKAFGNNLNNSYNGDIAQLISARSTTSWGNSGLTIGFANQNKTICQVEKKNLYSYAGIGNESSSINKNFFSNYSWNINVIIHELGHVLGSDHTQSCVWNGNNTAIDNCGPYYYSTNATNPFDTIDGINCYNSSNPILPSNGGTIMSYCHLISNVGINFINGFGEDQPNTPLTRIRSKICKNYRCESSYCFYDIHIGTENGGSNSYNGDYTVPDGSIDNRSVANNIYAYNKVESGGGATYLAGNSIYLRSSNDGGFHAKAGSNVVLKIEPCESMQYIVLENYESKGNNIENNNHEKTIVSLYPNPTSGLITLESNMKIVFWELTDEVGRIYKSGKIDDLEKIELNFSNLNNGIYFIKVHLKNGEFSFKKMIKK